MARASHRREGENPKVPTYRSVTTTAVESYSRAIPGVQLNAVQTGAGFGPNVVRSVASDEATICVSSVGFPVRVQTTMACDWVVVAQVSAAPPGTRWCGYDLEAGSTILYAPGAEHTAVSPAGVEYAAAIVRRRSIEEVADELRFDLRIPQLGSLRMLPPASNPRSLASVLGGVALAPIDSQHPSTLVRDVVHALASELSEEAHRHRLERMSVTESRRIVRRCSAFVNDEGGRPSIAELCSVAFVSERRLRHAFVDVFGVSPMTYFRDQRLSEARTRLTLPNSQKTVMEICMDVGIQNGGRFARRYAEVFGELPSQTRQRSMVG